MNSEIIQMLLIELQSMQEIYGPMRLKVVGSANPKYNLSIKRSDHDRKKERKKALGPTQQHFVNHSLQHQQHSTISKLKD